MQTFADRLTLRARAAGHCLCVGLDPHLDKIPPCFRRGTMHPQAPETLLAVEAFLLCVLGALKGQVDVIKPQSAFFEQLGSPGIALLGRLTRQARAEGFIVIMDAKRGDIGSTARAYARTYLEPGAELESDALTLNPYLGLDSLEPFIEAAHLHGRGLFILAKTSNPGSSDFQDRVVGEGPLFAAVAGALATRADALQGVDCGWSGLGVVVGATHPGDARLVRAACPSALFLVPGLGAQGASAQQAVSGFVPGPNGLEGGIVSASRSVLFPTKAATASSAQEVHNAVAASAVQTAQDLRLALNGSSQ